MEPSLKPFLQGAYQRAYVTTNLGDAMAFFGTRFGIDAFKVLRTFPLTVETPSGPARLVLNLAFAFAGDLMLELVEPVEDVSMLFRALLPDCGLAIIPHHVSVRIEGGLAEWQEYRRALANAFGLRADGALGKHVRFCFSDQRERIGVYLEAAWLGPNGEGTLRNVPRHIPASADLMAFWP